MLNSALSTDSALSDARGARGLWPAYSRCSCGLSPSTRGKLPIQKHTRHSRARGQAHLCLASASLTGVSVSFGHITQNWFSPRVGQDGPGPCALLVRSRCRRFLTVFGSVTCIKHKPAAGPHRPRTPCSPRHRAPAPCARTRSPDPYRPAAGPAPARSRSPAHSRSPPADVPPSAPAARPAGGNSPATVPRSRAQLRLPLMCCKRHAAHQAAVHFPHPGHPWPGQGRQPDQRGSARTIVPVLPFSARFVAAHRTNRDAHATLEPLE